MDRRANDDAASTPAHLLDELLGPDARRLVARHIEKLIAANRDPGPWPSLYREIRRLGAAARGEGAPVHPCWPSDVTVRRG